MPKPQFIFYCPNHVALFEVHPGWGHCKRCLKRRYGWTDEDLLLTPFQKMVVMEMADGSRLERWTWEWSTGRSEGSHLIPQDAGGQWMAFHPSYDKRLRWITVPKRTFEILRDRGWIFDLGPRSEGSDTHLWGLTEKANRFTGLVGKSKGAVGGSGR